MSDVLTCVFYTCRTAVWNESYPALQSRHLAQLQYSSCLHKECRLTLYICILLCPHDQVKHVQAQCLRCNVQQIPAKGKIALGRPQDSLDFMNVRQACSLNHPGLHNICTVVHPLRLCVVTTFVLKVGSISMRNRLDRLRVM